jgi:hypothetical protein
MILTNMMLSQRQHVSDNMKCFLKIKVQKQVKLSQTWDETKTKKSREMQNSGSGCFGVREAERHIGDTLVVTFLVLVWAMHLAGFIMLLN